MVNPWILPCSYTLIYFSVFLWTLALKLLHCWLYKTYGLVPLFQFYHHPVTMNWITDDVLKCLDIYCLLNISLHTYYLPHCCLCLNDVGDTSWLTCLLILPMAMKLLLVVYQLTPLLLLLWTLTILLLQTLASCYYKPLPFSLLWTLTILLLQTLTSLNTMNPHHLATTNPYLFNYYEPLPSSYCEFLPLSLPWTLTSLTTANPHLSLLQPHLYNCAYPWIWNLCFAAWNSH